MISILSNMQEATCLLQMHDQYTYLEKIKKSISIEMEPFKILIFGVPAVGQDTLVSALINYDVISNNVFYLPERCIPIEYKYGKEFEILLYLNESLKADFIPKYNDFNHRYQISEETYNTAFTYIKKFIDSGNKVVKVTISEYEYLKIFFQIFFIKKN